MISPPRPSSCIRGGMAPAAAMAAQFAALSCARSDSRLVAASMTGWSGLYNGRDATAYDDRLARR